MLSLIDWLMAATIAAPFALAVFVVVQEELGVDAAPSLSTMALIPVLHAEPVDSPDHDNHSHMEKLAA
jgi:hypothetical protein